MKIKKIKWLGHPVLGDLVLDFNDAHGIPYDNIILAGENGTGKTTIIESLSRFLNIGSFEYFDYIDYEVGPDTFQARQQVPPPNIKDFFAIANAAGNVTNINRNKNNDMAGIDATPNDPRRFGCVYSKARADYKTVQIKSTTTKSIDTDKYDTDKEDDFTNLKQLIVDVVNQDNSDYTEGNKALGLNPRSWPDFYLTSKTFRFANAFDTFFDKIKYSTVETTENGKNILFNKNGTLVSIDALSTGEKQIVFRGIYLLKNSGNLDGGIAMIDEPELSMHPKWQGKILQYYRKLFTNGAVQRTQLFFATHSEYVLKEALTDKQRCLVIVLNENGGLITSKRIDAPSVLPSITNAETNYLAFDVVSNDYHIELYGHLQDKWGGVNVKRCDDLILANQDYVAAQHARASANGATNYGTLPTFIRNVIHHPDGIRLFNETELRTSIELLIRLCRLP